MVEWKKLGEVCSFNRGRTITAKDAVEGSIPVIAGGQTPSYYHNVANRKGECITVAGSGAYAGFVSYWNQPIFVSDAFTVDPKEILKHKFLFHWLKMNQSNVFATQKGAGVPHVHGKDIANFIIPIPSLSEQARIVGILDTFTAAIDNLKGQIALRRKQYEYYRDQLLDLEGKDGVEMKTLGEIGNFIRGSGIQKSDFVDEGFPCIHYGQIHTKYGISATKAISQIDETLYKKSKKAVKGDVVLATTSEDAEGCAKPVAWLGEEEVAVSGDAYIYHHDQNGKFMAYQFMTHNFMLFKIMNATGAKVVRISGDNMANYEFPLPSLEEQHRIVSILDTFEASIRNLEAQLKQREKQYEYYRNKLLTFE